MRRIFKCAFAYKWQFDGLEMTLCGWEGVKIQLASYRIKEDVDTEQVILTGHIPFQQ